MPCGLAHASYSLPEWQAVTLTFFVPCSSKCTENNYNYYDVLTLKTSTEKHILISAAIIACFEVLFYSDYKPPWIKASRFI